MNKNKKWNASRHLLVVADARKGKMASVLVPALLKRCDASRIVIDPKDELATVSANMAKKNGGVMTLNPFLVPPPKQLEACSNWFRLCIGTAITNLIKAQRKGVKDDAARRCGREIRTPRTDDLAGIVSVVRACEPYLTAHMSYIYWMQIRQCRDTCAVAVLDGEVVGWCSIIPGSPGKYFVHQLGVTPKARRHGLAQSLLMHLVNKLKNKTARPELEFTIDRRNGAALDLVNAVAQEAGMHLRKIAEPVGLLEEGCAEDLYLMTPVASRRADFSNEVANILWTTTERTEATVTNGLNS